MKIQKIVFLDHEVFGSHEVILGNPDVTEIVFLVGNNGSGKTKVLDIIHRAFTEPFSHPGYYEYTIYIVFSPDEMATYGLAQSEVRCLIRKNAAGNSRYFQFADGTDVASLIANATKVVFSTIEVNFNDSAINSVTSKNIDEEQVPREKSQNLSTEIPQLLVDIKNLDDSDIASWHNSHKATGHPGPFPDVGTRLSRFTEAFHKIYGGEKTFSEIKNVGGTKQIVFVDSANKEVPLDGLSTGEKQIIYRVGYILKNLGNIGGGIVLIDEPEISLHPSWQLKLKDFLLEIFNGQNVQIIAATHSPYIFQGLNETREACIKIDRSAPVSQKVNLVFPGVPYTPSVQLITYLAYGVFDEILHIELYTLLQIREGRDKINHATRGIEDWLRNPGGGNMAVYKSFIRTGQTSLTEESIMTWIRNRIHHPDELARPSFSKAELKSSIDQMITLLS